MQDELENQDSLNPEGDGQDTNSDNGEDESSQKIKKLDEYGRNQKTRAEKAEAEAKKWKAEAEKAKKHINSGESEPPKASEQSNEPDYAKLAFLEGKGIKHPDDQKVVQDEAKRLKLPLTDILGMEHVQSKLKGAQKQRDAEDGMPEKSGKPSGSNKTSVDYWVNKKKSDGTFDTPDDLELADKVISARVKTQNDQNKFSDDLYSG